MATVYLAHDLRHNSNVAVKVLHPELAAFIGQARFTREIQVTARLQHPNILPIFDSGYSGALHYYVTPYIEGESLAQRILREGQLAIDAALDITCEVADALAHAHSHGLVHRDIKPANVLLAHGHAMIADFGIARLAEKDADRLTASGIALGTANYMSPEQAAGGSVDGRSDIYSLGCVLYEMLAGHPPFSGANAQAVIARHMVDPVPQLASVRPTVNPAVEATIRKAMAKSPADRFADAGEFQRAIRQAQMGITPNPPIASGAGRGWRMSRRTVAIAAATVIAIVAGIFAAQRIAQLRGHGADATSGLDPNRVAVLYFEDNSPDHNMAYLANGITESLIRELSSVPVLHVISRNGVRQFRDHPTTLDTMAAALHAGSFVEGSVERSGGKVRVAVDFVDAVTGRHMDSRSIEHSVADIFGLEDAVAQQVATILRTRLGQEIRMRQAQKGTASAQARELLLRAEQARDNAAEVTSHQHAGDVQDALAFLQTADSVLALAETADPKWVQPTVERGWVMLDRANLSPSNARAQALRQALAHAARALGKGPQDPYALELQGTGLWRLAIAIPGSTRNETDVRRAEQDLRRAVSLQPGLASAWSTLSQLLRIDKGALAEANVAARRALAEDAYLEDAPVILEQIARSELLLGDYQAAIDACNEGLRRFPADRRFLYLRLTLMVVDTALPQNPRVAWNLVSQIDQLDPQASAAAAGRPYDRIFRRMSAAAVSARAGDRDSARAVIAWARRQASSDSGLSADLNYDEAYIQMALGDKETALGLLRRYVAAQPIMKSYIARDPLFAPLRADARFKAMIQTP